MSLTYVPQSTTQQAQFTGWGVHPARPATKKKKKKIRTFEICYVPVFCSSTMCSIRFQRRSRTHAQTSHRNKKKPEGKRLKNPFTRTAKKRPILILSFLSPKTWMHFYYRSSTHRHPPSKKKKKKVQTHIHNCFISSNPHPIHATFVPSATITSSFSTFSFSTFFGRNKHSVPSEHTAQCLEYI